MSPLQLLLRYNSAVGRDPLPRIRELASELSLLVDASFEEEPSPGKRLKVVSIRGDEGGLRELERQLQRFPAVTAKLVAVSSAS